VVYRSSFSEIKQSKQAAETAAGQLRDLFGVGTKKVDWKFFYSTRVMLTPRFVGKTEAWHFIRSTRWPEVEENRAWVV